MWIQRDVSLWFYCDTGVSVPTIAALRVSTVTEAEINSHSGTG